MVCEEDRDAWTNSISQHKLGALCGPSKKVERFVSILDTLRVGC